MRFVPLLFLLLLVTAAPTRAWVTMCNAAIPATMVDSVSSQSAYPGLVFRFKITTDANILGDIVPENTIGYGYVREVTAASNHDRNGSLILDTREVIYKNKAIQVINDPRDASLWAPAETTTERATGYIPIPGIVRQAVNEVRHGKDVTIGPGFNFHVIGWGDPRKMHPCRKVGN